MIGKDKFLNMKTISKLFMLTFCCVIFLGIQFIFHNNLPYRTLRLSKFSMFKQRNQNGVLETTTIKDIKNKSFLRGNISYVKNPLVSFYSSCQKDCIRQDWKMVIFVKSHTLNEDRRNLIRKTWGSLTHLNGAEFRTVFVVGSSNAEDEAFLMSESRNHNDILQIRRPDTYRNIVWKTLVGMQWACDYLNATDYFSTADDDVLLNPLLLKQAIDYYEEAFHFTTMPIICMYDLWSYKGKPDRDPMSKYYVSWEQYNGTSWPKFCPGGMYTIRIDIARKLYQASRTTPLLPVDDVWLTGIIRKKIYYYDTMVVAAKPRAVVHYMGFYLKMSQKKFRKDWNENISNITSVAECICQVNIREQTVNTW